MITKVLKKCFQNHSYFDGLMIILMGQVKRKVPNVKILFFYYQFTKQSVNPSMLLELTMEENTAKKVNTSVLVLFLGCFIQHLVGEGEDEDVLIAKVEFSRALKRQLYLFSGISQSNIINFKRMQKLNLLIEKYVSFSSNSESHLSRGRINEFQLIITNLTKIDVAPLKIKYGFYHISFLMECIAEGPGKNDLSFTGLIQILNILLRQGSGFKIQAPNKLMSALNDHLCSSQKYGGSPKVIANVIWLVGRCIQMGGDRTTLITCLSQSKLIETCLECSSYQPSTARGMALLLAYMSKRQLLQKQFCLKLLHHLEKFTQKDTIREVLSLLRKIGIEKVKVESSLMKKLGNILEKYFQQSQVKQFQKHQNWSLLVLVSHAHHDFIGKLGLTQVLAKVLSEPVIQISQEMLNKVNELLGLVIEVGTEEMFLRVAMENVFLNVVARRFFIQYHEKIGSQFFIEILSGNLPQIIAEKMSIEGEKDKVLKMLICLKRTANLLGLDVFYEYKFKQVASEIVDGKKVGGSSGELIDLWREVSEGNVRGGDVHHDFFY